MSKKIFVLTLFTTATLLCACTTSQTSDTSEVVSESASTAEVSAESITGTEVSDENTTATEVSDESPSDNEALADELKPFSSFDISGMEKTDGNKYYKDFRVDNILHFADGLPDLYYHMYVPQSYDGSEPYALYITLPGHGTHYFDGDGCAYNLIYEHFATNAKDYEEKMIIVAPQLEDYDREPEKDTYQTDIHLPQVIRLTEYLFTMYNINHDRVYISGYSRGGEIMSLAISQRPELYSAALHVSSIWKDDISKTAAAHIPVYFVIGESDEAYGSEPVKATYEELTALYKEEGLSEDEIGRIAVLDIKDPEYFTSQGYDDQHLGADLFSYDEKVMGWLLNYNKK